MISLAVVRAYCKMRVGMCNDGQGRSQPENVVPLGKFQSYHTKIFAWWDEITLLVMVTSICIKASPGFVNRIHCIRYCFFLKSICAEVR